MEALAELKGDERPDDREIELYLKGTLNINPNVNP